MIEQVLQRFETTPDTQLYPGCPRETILGLEEHLGVRLPDAHRTFLARSDGAEAFGGYFRLLGALRGAPTNLAVWNHENYWKFAWEGRAAEFLCFGDTGWGDQYAYYLPSLRMSAEPEVYLLDFISMEPIRIADSFTSFFAGEFLRRAESPDDPMTVAARETFGDLRDADHLVYTPSLRLGTAVRIENVDVMDARVAMMINGDMATQCDALPEGARVTAVDLETDEHGRLRLRLRWLPPA